MKNLRREKAELAKNSRSTQKEREEKRKGQFNEVVKLQMAVVKVFPHSISIDVVFVFFPLLLLATKALLANAEIFFFSFFRLFTLRPDEKHSSFVWCDE